MSPRRVWRLLREPRVVTALSGVIWLLCILVGTVALVAPPVTVATVVHPFVMWIWGGLFLLGGVAGLIGCWLIPQPWWRDIEQLAVISAGSGVLIYAGIAIYLQAVSGGSLLVQIGIVAIALVALLKRWVEIDDPSHAYTRWGRSRGDA